MTKPRLATWGERFLAWLVDIIILGIAISLIRGFLWAAWISFNWAPGVPMWIPFVDFGLSNIAYFLYWLSMEGAYGQSFGKMLLNIKVVRIDGAKINMAQAAIQSVGKAFLLPIDCILGWILYPASRHRMFNRLSGTSVVKA